MHTDEAGFTYLSLLFAIAAMGVALAAVGEVWHTAQVREKERELLFMGDEFRRAIGAYYEAGPGPLKRYPQALTDLLKDPRQPGIKRHLRRIYTDPFTGKAEWGVLKATDGGIRGVHSLSERRPLKTANFRAADEAFSGKTTYKEWVFTYQPKQSQMKKNGPAGAPQAIPATPSQARSQ